MHPTALTTLQLELKHVVLPWTPVRPVHSIDQFDRSNYLNRSNLPHRRPEFWLVRGGSDSKLDRVSPGWIGPHQLMADVTMTSARTRVTLARTRGHLQGACSTHPNAPKAHDRAWGCVRPPLEVHHWGFFFFLVSLSMFGIYNQNQNFPNKNFEKRGKTVYMSSRLT